MDVDEETVAVPAEWNIPGDVQEGDYFVTFDAPSPPIPPTRAPRHHHAASSGEAIKSRFKNTPSDVLGASGKTMTASVRCHNIEKGAEYHFCRKFGAAPKVLKGNRWVIQLLVTTATLDGWTFADYFRRGRSIHSSA